LRGLGPRSGILVIGIWLAGTDGFAAEQDAAAALTPTVEEKAEPDAASIGQSAVDGSDVAADEQSRVDESNAALGEPNGAEVVSGEVSPVDTAPVVASPTQGQPANPFYSSSDEETSPSYWGLMTRLGLGLGMVVCLAWGAMWILRRTSVGQQMVANGGAIRVIERTFLAPKKAIYLVDIGGRTLALGVTDEHITSLGQWDPGELLIAQPEPPPNISSAFKTLLGQMRKQTAGEAS